MVRAVPAPGLFFSATTQSQCITVTNAPFRMSSPYAHVSETAGAIPLRLVGCVPVVGPHAPRWRERKRWNMSQETSTDVVNDTTEDVEKPKARRAPRRK